MSPALNILDGIPINVVSVDLLRSHNHTAGLFY